MKKSLSFLLFLLLSLLSLTSWANTEDDLLDFLDRSAEEIRIQVLKNEVLVSQGRASEGVYFYDLRYQYNGVTTVSSDKAIQLNQTFSTYGNNAIFVLMPLTAESETGKAVAISTMRTYVKRVANKLDPTGSHSVIGLSTIIGLNGEMYSFPTQVVGVNANQEVANSNKSSLEGVTCKQLECFLNAIGPNIIASSTSISAFLGIDATSEMVENQEVDVTAIPIYFTFKSNYSTGFTTTALGYENLLECYTQFARTPEISRFIPTGKKTDCIDRWRLEWHWVNARTVTAKTDYYQSISYADLWKYFSYFSTRSEVENFIFDIYPQYVNDFLNQRKTRFSIENIETYLKIAQLAKLLGQDRWDTYNRLSGTTSDVNTVYASLLNYYNNNSVLLCKEKECILGILRKCTKVTDDKFGVLSYEERVHILDIFLKDGLSSIVPGTINSFGTCPFERITEIEIAEKLFLSTLYFDKNQLQKYITYEYIRDHINIYLSEDDDFSDDEERAIVFLISKFPRDHADQFLHNLYSANLIQILDPKIQDQILMYGGDNYKGFYSELILLYKESDLYIEKLNELIDEENIVKRTIYYGDYRGWDNQATLGGHTGLLPIGAFAENFTVSNDLNKVEIQRYVVTGYNKTLVPGAGYIYDEILSLDEKISLEPYDLIVFINYSTLNLSNEGELIYGTSYQYVPAIFLQHVKEKQFTQNVMTAVSITADVVTIFTAGPAIVAHGGKIRRIIAACEVLGAVTNLAANSVVIQDPEIQEALGYFNILVGIVGGVEGINGLSHVSFSGIYKNAFKTGSKLSEYSVDQILDIQRSFVTSCANSKDALLRMLNSKNAAVKELAQNIKNLADELGRKFGITVNWLGRYVAQSGPELRDYLNSIANKPKGVSYSGVLYRNIRSGLNNPNPRYIIRNPTSDIDNRFQAGLYLSANKTGNTFEAIHYNGSTNGRDLYKFTNVNLENLLDLSDIEILSMLGTSREQMKLISTDNLLQYEFTQEVASWAKKNGYTGIKFEGVRGGTVNYINIVIFDEKTVLQSLTNFGQIEW